MNIYKTASLQLSSDNEQALSDFISSLLADEDKGILEKEDLISYFEEVIYPAITQLTQSLKEASGAGKDLEDVFSDEVGELLYDEDEAQVLFESFGPEFFLNDFNLIKSAIQSFLSRFNFPAPEAPTEVVAPQAKPAVVTSPSQTEEDLDDAMSYSDKVSEAERPGIPFRDRVQYFIDTFLPEELVKYFFGLKYRRESEFKEFYPAPEAIDRMIGNLRGISDSYRQSKSNRSLSNRSFDELQDSISKLLLYSFGKGIVSSNELDKFIQENRELNPALTDQRIEVDSEKKEEKKGEKKKRESAEPSRRARTIVAPYTRETLYQNNPLFSTDAEKIRERVEAQKLSGVLVSPFINFPSGSIESLEQLESQDLPSLDTDALERFVSLSIGELGSIYREISARVDSKQRVSSKSPDASRLNNIMYTIKISDNQTLQSIEAYERVLLTFKDSEFKVLQQERIKKLKNLFIENCGSKAIFLSDAIRSDSPQGNKTSDMLRYMSAYISSPFLFNFAFLARNQEFKVEKYATKRYISVSPGDLTSLADNCLEASRDFFYKKLESFLAPSYGGSASDFVGEVSLNFRYIFNEAIKRQYKVSTKYEVRHCPTCYKAIPYSLGVTYRNADRNNPVFTAPVVSPFREVKGQIIPISQSEYVEGNRKFSLTDKYLSRFRAIGASLDDESGSDRSQNDHEYIFVSELVKKDKSSGGMTWLEIQDYLNSQNPHHQREGWHRRASAMLDLGGKQLSIKKTITEIMSRCPIEPVNPSQTNKEGMGSFCGLNPQPVATTSLSPRLSFQPSYSGTWVSPKSKNETKAKPLTPEGWVRKEDLEHAEKAMRGGFKFSSKSFACPCRIPNPTKEQVSLHKNIMVAKNGTVGSTNVYPTTPNGNLDTAIDPNTVAFMACAAPTSLSSFNRSESDGPAFILQYLSSIKGTYGQDYYRFLNYLIANGIDPQDISELDESLAMYVTQKTSSYKIPSSVKDRIMKIGQILVEASDKKFAPEKYLGFTDQQAFFNILNDMPLVCPFGHRFKVQDSLNLAKAYSRFFGNQISSQYSSLVTTEGSENAAAYQRSNITESSLHFHEDAWPKEGFFKSEVLFSVSSLDGKIQSSSLTGVDAAGEDVESETDIRTLPQTEELGDIDDDLNYYSPAPGRTKIQEKSSRKFLQVTEPKYRSLITVIKKTALMIDTYITTSLPTSSAGILNLLQSQSRSLTPQNIKEKITASLEGGGKNYPALINTLVRSNDNFKNFDSSKITEFTNKIVEEISKSMMDVFTYVYEEVGRNIATVSDEEVFNLNIDNSISKKILTDSILSSLDIFRTRGAANPFSGKDIFKIVEGLVEALVSSSNFIKFLFEESWSMSKNNFSEVFGARISTISYALRLVKALSDLYKKYFDKNNSFDYLGFDIGVDLSSYPFTIGEGKRFSIYNDLRSLPEDINSIIRSQKNCFKPMGNNTESYPRRMDLFYTELHSYIRQAYVDAAMPNSLVSATDYLNQRIKNEIKDQKRAKQIADGLISSLPLRTIRLAYNYDSDDPETFSYKNSPIRWRVPYFSQEITEVRGELNKVGAWLVAPSYSSSNIRLPDGSYLPRFSTKTESEAIELKNKLEQQYKDVASGLSKVTYDVLVDDYFVSKDKEVSVLIKSGETFIPPAEYTSAIPTNTEFVLKVINAKYLPFAIYFKSGSSDKISLNIIRISPAINPTNSYLVAVKLPPEVTAAVSNPEFEIRYQVTEGERLPIVKNNNNINTSVVQVGTIRPKNNAETFWPQLPSEEPNAPSYSTLWNRQYKAKSGGFSNRWTYAGTILPILDVASENSPNTNISKASSVPIVDYNFIIDFDGEPLNISPLFMRGRVAFTEEGGRIIAGDLERIKRIEDEIIDDEERLERSGDDRERAAIAREIASKVSKIKAYELKIDTNRAYVPYSLNGFKKEAFYSPTPQLVNPYHAFRIINNPSIRGLTISDITKEKLKDFVVRVYNLQPIINFLVALGLDVKADDLFDESRMRVINNIIAAKGKLVPELKGKQDIISYINYYIKNSGWLSESGEFFNIKVDKSLDLQDPLGSTFMQFSTMVTRPKPGVAPDMADLINSGKKENILGSQKRLDIQKNIYSYLQENSIRYLESETELPILEEDEDEDDENEEDENEADDHLRDFNKIPLRANKLRGMIGIADAKDMLFRGIPNFKM